MHIWIDADACPVVIKNIVFKAAERTHIPKSESYIIVINIRFC